MKIDDEIKAHFRNDYHRVIINLTYSVNQLNYQFLQQIKKHKLTDQQYNILMILNTVNPSGPVSIGFIRERMPDKNSDVSRIVDRLVEKELVSRKENPNDRRQKDLEITEKGVALISEMGYCEKETENLFRYLTLDEVRQLNHLLDKLRG
jgi:MarR family transcriptional regulator, multiple gene regulator MgrA